MKIFWLFIFLSSAASIFCHTETVLDIEKLPELRTKQYPIHPYQKILIFSAPRTGSSLTYNIFRFLFEDEKNFNHPYNEFSKDCLVLKTHRYRELHLLDDENVLYIVTIRDPLESSISNYRICTRAIDNLQAFARMLIERHRDYLVFCEELRNSGRRVIFVKYENFQNNLDYFINLVEELFSFKVDVSDKTIIQKGYSKENIFFYIKSLQDFQEYLPISGFHGKHINVSPYDPPEEFLYWLKYYFKEEEVYFEKFGYTSL